MDTLHELTGQWFQLNDMLSDPDADEQMIHDTLEAIEGEIECKAENIAIIVSELTSRANAIYAEEERLKARRNALVNRAAYLKQNLQESMLLTGKTKFKTNLYSFGIQKNPPVVVLDCEVSELPNEFVKYSEPTADKKAIMTLLKNGVPFQWAHLEQGESLRIR